MPSEVLVIRPKARSYLKLSLSAELQHGSVQSSERVPNVECEADALTEEKLASQDFFGRGIRELNREPVKTTSASLFEVWDIWKIWQIWKRCGGLEKSGGPNLSSFA